MDRNIEIRLRHWVYLDGEKFLGPGRCEILGHIEQTGSISKAAKEMGLSYKKAWALVDSMNSQGKGPYVVTQKGGTKGGGTELTEAGKALLKAYKTLDNKLQAIINAETELQKLI